VLAARVATAAVLIAGLLAALFLAPPSVLAVLAAVVVGLAAFEWGRLCGLGAARLYAIAAAIAFLLLAWFRVSQAAFAIGALFWLLVVPVWFWRGVRRSHARLLASAGWAVLLPTGLALIFLPPLHVLAVLGLTWIADTAAYFAGRRFGRHKLAPSISPGKTWEGVAGGVAGVLLYAIICGTFIEGIAWVPYVAAAGLLAMLSVVGDLFESAAKRQAGAKDSGTMLPGHGGILDRIDSATSTLPVAALLWPLVVGK
jgi:phosphatidate cytidylyltransferase